MGVLLNKENLSFPPPPFSPRGDLSKKRALITTYTQEKEGYFSPSLLTISKKCRTYTLSCPITVFGSKIQSRWTLNAAAAQSAKPFTVKMIKKPSFKWGDEKKWVFFALMISYKPLAVDTRSHSLSLLY